MKKLALILTFVFAVSVMFAQVTNNTWLWQTGYGNLALITQNAGQDMDGTNNLYMYQNGSYNDMYATQYGDFNNFFGEQYGFRNFGKVEQDGDVVADDLINTSTLYQGGLQNDMYVHQDGRVTGTPYTPVINNAWAYQFGSQGFYYLGQQYGAGSDHGAVNTSTLYQGGNYNDAILDQWAIRNNSFISQFGFRNFADLDQSSLVTYYNASLNQSTVVQTGYDEDVYVGQLGHFNDSWITQDGMYNAARLYQEAVIENDAWNWQHGFVEYLNVIQHYNGAPDATWFAAYK